MSTRVQKGGTVFRPVTKARSRTVENSTSQLPQNISALLPPAQAPDFSLQGNTDHAVPAAVANTIRPGFPISISSSRIASRVQIPENGPQPAVEETTTSVIPSHVDVPIIQQVRQHQLDTSTRPETLVATSAKKPKKARRPATPAFEADPGPGEGLDPTSVTMATLCDDTGHGRMSSKAAQILDNHLAWKKSNKEKRARMRVMMEAKKYGRNEDGDGVPANRPDTESERTAIINAEPGPSASTQSVPENISSVEDGSGQGFDYSQNVTTSRYNVQVRIGPNGETIVDEESLFVDRNAEEDPTEYTHVEESDVTKFVNSATYSKRFRGSRWSAEETELFYDALSQFGENYELISYVLPGRDRKACKNKFKSEDKKNPQRINFCLNNRKPYDMQTLARMTGKDFSGPTPEIRAPAVLSLAEPESSLKTSEPRVLDPTMTLSSTASELEEVVGEISSFDPE